MITDAVTFVLNKELTLKDISKRNEYKIYLVKRDEFANLRGEKFERASLKTRHTDDNITLKLANGIRVFDLKINELNGRVVDLLIENKVLLTTDYELATVMQILVTDKYTKVGGAVKVHIDQSEDGEIIEIPEDKIFNAVKEKKIRFKKESNIQQVTKQAGSQSVVREKIQVKEETNNRINEQNVKQKEIRDEKRNKEMITDLDSEDIDLEKEEVTTKVVLRNIDPKSTTIEVSLSERLDEEFVDQVGRECPIDVHSALTLQIFRKQLIDIADNREYFLGRGFNIIVFSSIDKIDGNCIIERTSKGLYYVSDPKIARNILFVYSIMSQDILFNPKVMVGLNSLNHLLNVTLTTIAMMDAKHSTIDNELHVIKRKDYVAVGF